MKSISSASHPSHSLLGELRALCNRCMCADVLVLDARALRVWASASGDGLLIDAQPLLHEALRELGVSSGGLLEALENEDPTVSIPPPDQPDPGSSDSLGPLEVVEALEDDGRSTVFRARVHAAVPEHELVIVRRVRAPGCGDDPSVHALLADTRRAADLVHPNVAQVFDVGVDHDAYWVVMENLVGTRLSEVMLGSDEGRGAPRPVFAAAVGVQAAQGLHAVHEVRSVEDERLDSAYRHLMPRGVIVTTDGQVKLLPLASAAYLGPEPGGRYLPPEHESGAPWDRRSDVFTLGALLWELATGLRLAAAGEGPIPPPSTVVEGIPPALETVVMRALEERPESRFATADDVAFALRSFLSSVGTADPQTPAKAWLATASERTIPIPLDRLEASDSGCARLRERVLEHVTSNVSLESVRRGERVRYVHAAGDLGYIAVSFARLYLLVLVYDGEFEATRPKVALKRSLPRIQSLMSAIAAHVLS